MSDPTKELHALCMHLGEVENQMQPLKAEREALRAQISEQVEDLGGKTKVAGFGQLEITPSTIVTGYDRKRMDELIIALTAKAPEIAAQIAACRTESMRTGGLRITPEKRGK